MFHIEFMGALPYLLVGVERDAYFSVLYLRMCHEILYRRDDFGDSGFVVGTEQRVAVSDNEVLPLVVEQFGELSGRKHNRFFGIESYITAVVVFHYARIHIVSAEVGRCIKVCDKAHDRHFAVHIGRQCGHKIAVFIECHIFQPHLLQFLFKDLRKFVLTGGGGGEVGQFVALSVELHIFQKTFGNIHNFCCF